MIHNIQARQRGKGRQGTGLNDGVTASLEGYQCCSWSLRP
jgi:hypothetical protein